MDERLTFEGNFCEIARCRETRWGKNCPDGACSQRKVWERLKQYEDSDAVPVVRCKDCKYRYTDSWCEYVDDDNFYCARGEWKDGADNG